MILAADSSTGTAETDADETEGTEGTELAVVVADEIEGTQLSVELTSGAAESGRTQLGVRPSAVNPSDARLVRKVSPNDNLSIGLDQLSTGAESGNCVPPTGMPMSEFGTNSRHGNDGSTGQGRTTRRVTLMTSLSTSQKAMARTARA